MAAYRLIVEIREADKLVVTHIFHGASEREAVHYYESHLKADAFLRECIEHGVFAGDVACRAKMHWEVS